MSRIVIDRAEIEGKLAFHQRAADDCRRRLKLFDSLSGEPGGRRVSKSHAALRFLAQAGPDGVGAGEIASQSGFRQNSAGVWLYQNKNWVERVRVGRYRLSEAGRQRLAKLEGEGVPTATTRQTEVAQEATA